MIYLFLFGLLLICIATASSWAGVRDRRAALMARAPSRGRVEALMHRLPPCDEWLDDRYDSNRN